MEIEEKLLVVEKMQQYIIAHLDEKITIEMLSQAVQYSKWHIQRLFQECMGMPVFSYIRSLRLSKAALQLRDENIKVIDAALQAQFSSHDGFTRAFKQQFSLTPRNYKEGKPAISLFTYYPVTSRIHLQTYQEQEHMQEFFDVTTVAVKRPARKLILQRAQEAVDYWSYCEEKGCEWEGYLNSIAEKFDTAALVTLPSQLVAPGTAKYAAGVEVPLSFEKTLLDAYEIITLAPSTMLYFISAPYEKEEDFCGAIDAVMQAIEQFSFAEKGYARRRDMPLFNFGADQAQGARIAVPVSVIENR
ncbi:MAG: helix-turn-helix domain-containing protein [Christensenellaceae bacterium]|jgi:AraC family transcriptional regulator